MSKALRTMAVTLLMLVPAAIWAQSPQDQLRQCRSENRQAHTAIARMFADARSQGKVSRTEMAQFEREEANLKRHEQSLNRNGLTLPECRQITKELAAERAYVQRIAATPATPLGQCRTDNRQTHAAILKMFTDARADGKVSRTEMAQFEREEANLKRHEQSLNRDGLTLPECQQIAKELAVERAYVQKIAASPVAPVAPCRTENLNLHTEILRMFQDARAKGMVSRNEAQNFDREEANLKRLQQNLNRGGLTYAECQQITRELQTERAYVQRIASTRTEDPRVTQCRTENLKAHAEIVKMFQDARATGKVSRSEAQGFAEREARLERHKENLNKGGLTVPECQQIGRELAAERDYVFRIAH